MVVVLCYIRAVGRNIRKENIKGARTVRKGFFSHKEVLKKEKEPNIFKPTVWIQDYVYLSIECWAEVWFVSFPKKVWDCEDKRRY